MRIPHFLRPPKQGAQPSNCIWLDTETKPRKDAAGRDLHFLNFGWAAYQQQRQADVWTEPEWLRFTDNDTLWQWIISKTRPKTVLYLFAHNGGFDLPVIEAFTRLPALGFTLTRAVCDAPPIILSWRRGTATIKFIDTLNIWRMPLAKLAKAYGTEKYPMPAPDASAEEWDRYGKNDTDIIRRAIIGWLAFLRQHDLGPFAPTLASQAYKTFKYRFMKHQILIDTNVKALSLSRAAYVGGRTECFRIGEFDGPVYYLDVNSMYPSVMAENDYPCKLVSFYKFPTDSELDEWRDKYIMVAHVHLDTDRPDFPVIHENKLVFPVGRFETWLAHPELCHAIDCGAIREVESVALYRKDPIFSEFIGTLYPLRMAARAAGDSTNDHNLKILINSLYGKTGQRGRRFEEIGTTDPNAVWVHDEVDMDTGDHVRYRAFGGLVQAWIDDEEGAESFPAIAACVTSYARMVLLEAIERAGRANVFYCDTDSMFVNQRGYDRMADLVDPDRLGAWKLEQVVDRLTINGAKDYVMDGKRRLKGIRDQAVQLSRNTWEQDKFVGFRGLLREGSLASPVVHRQEKTLSRQYTKGIVTRSGRVWPLRLGGSGRRGR